MNRTWIALATAAVIVGSLGLGHDACAEARDYFKIDRATFVMNLQPASALYSMNSDDFIVENRQFRQDSVNGNFSFLPNGKLGLGLNTEKMLYDITVGGGYLYNNAVTAPVLLGDISARFKIGDALTLGPHVGPVYISSPTWKGDSDISLSGTMGVLGGLMVTAGNFAAQWSVVLSLDYMSCKLDAENGKDWMVKSESFDLSGYVAQIGVIYRWDKDGGL